MFVPVHAGTLDLLILHTLDLRPMHGWAIADRISQVTHRAFEVKAGSFLPALHRLEQESWIEGEWQESAGALRVRSYALTRDEVQLAGRHLRRQAVAGVCHRTNHTPRTARTISPSVSSSAIRTRCGNQNASPMHSSATGHGSTRHPPSRYIGLPYSVCG